MSFISPPSLTLIDSATDKAEISLFLSIQRFNRIIREIKRSIYRRPQRIWKQPS
jgi:uridine kinase